MSPLISTVELAGMLDRASGADGDPVILDATTTLPGERFDPDAAFRDGHLPGARRFSIELFSDPDTALPHMVPSQGRFVRLIEALGVNNHDDVVIYDQTGVASAARAWWLLGLFGHDRVRVLDGGLPQWRAEGQALEFGEAAPAAPGRFVAMPRLARLAGLGAVAAWSAAIATDAEGAGRMRLLDARSRGRFEATAPEPRSGLPGGHIPGAMSLPFGELLRDGTRFLPAEALRARFAAAGVAPGDRVVTSCGSGLTASVLSLGLAACGEDPGALYDGSWTEWAQSGQPRAVGTGSERPR